MRGMNESKLRRVIDAIPATAWSVRPDGAVDFVNQRYLEYTGLSLRQALADPAGTVHPDDLPAVMQGWSAALATGRPYEAEMRLRRADGTYRWFVVRTVPLRDRRGKIVKWYGASSEIEGRNRTSASHEAERKALASLSVREREVLKLLAEGSSVVRIGLRLELSQKTVETYRRRAMRKLRLSSLTAVVKFALKHGLIALE